MKKLSWWWIGWFLMKFAKPQNRDFVTTRTRRIFALRIWNFTVRAYSPSATRWLKEIENILGFADFMSLAKLPFWEFKPKTFKNIPNFNTSVWGFLSNFELWKCPKTIQEPFLALLTWFLYFLAKFLKKCSCRPGKMPRLTAHQARKIVWLYLQKIDFSENNFKHAKCADTFM